jgi:hypothetical protein
VSSTCCFTSISLNYADRAMLLASTIKAHHPEWLLWLFISDRIPRDFDISPLADYFDRIQWIEELEIPDIIPWIFGHDVVELCTAVKGQILCNLLNQGFEKVVYLDPDIALLDSLDPVIELLERNSVILTPHLLAAETDDGAIVDNEIGTLVHGTYNLGFLAVRADPDGRACAEWWRDRLMRYCVDDPSRGLFTDQRWCDLIPGLFDRVHVLRDPGYNVASWNLNQRPIQIRQDGAITVAGAPLRFFHFSKIKTVGATMIRRYAGGTEALEIAKWYASRLKEFTGLLEAPKEWGFAAFADGAPISRAHRRVYRERSDLRMAFADPFASGPGTFQSWFVNDYGV